MPTIRATVLDTSGGIERFFGDLRAANTLGKAERLILDISAVRFLHPDSALALLMAVRLWNRWTGAVTLITGIQEAVHQYMERIDFFRHCSPWLDVERELEPSARLNRSEASQSLLELHPIASEDSRNSADVAAATRRAKTILSSWFDKDSLAVGRLLTILAEIGSNVVHSQDSGFALIQRYRDTSGGHLGSKVTMSIADLGIGIESSLRNNRHRATGLGIHPPTGAEAIIRALDLGVSSRGTVAGTGLFVVKTMVEEWSGSMFIRSETSSVTFQLGQVVAQENLNRIPGTQVTISVRGAFGSAF